MQDFKPEDVIDLKISPWQEEVDLERVLLLQVLVENLHENNVPAYFRGAYLVYADKDDQEIDFQIYDPKLELIWFKI